MSFVNNRCAIVVILATRFLVLGSRLEGACMRQILIIVDTCVCVGYFSSKIESFLLIEVLLSSSSSISDPAGLIIY